MKRKKIFGKVVWFRGFRTGVEAKSEAFPDKILNFFNSKIGKKPKLLLERFFKD